ncbi:chaperone protein DNAj [Perkinsela sp. CCAP 1560/4]|nr:chaperone protein DNAj [Perkinsela sp. CCAP 1560/4]|eukprot:KNH08068.1 chaperone protein DNAj [Perkinsela sp. CCAP 1560/4]
MFHVTALFRAPTAEEVRRALATLSLTSAQAIDKKLLKKRYLELVKKNHPDTGGDAEKMKSISTAYQTLRSVTRMPDPQEKPSQAAPFQHQRRERQPQDSIFTDRGMPADWINAEMLHRMARESSFPRSSGHPMSSFMRNSYDPHFRPFSFQSAFGNIIRAYVFMALIAYLVLLLLERMVEMQTQSPPTNTRLSRLSDAGDAYQKRVEIMQNRNRAKQTDRPNNNYFTIRKEEKAAEKIHHKHAAYQKIPSSVRGVDYYYPIKER